MEFLTKNSSSVAIVISSDSDDDFPHLSHENVSSSIDEADNIVEVSAQNTNQTIGTSIIEAEVQVILYI